MIYLCVNYSVTLHYFINKHEAYLSANYATSRQVAFWKKKTESEKKETIKMDTTYLELLK